VLDVRPDLWFFTCQASDDRLMPAALGLEALWQLLGFFLAWSGGPGRGRALAVAQLKIAGTVSPAARLVEYGIDVKKFKRARVTLGIADGWVKVDGFVVTAVKTLKFGLFTGESVVSRARVP
jgi:3-hydroxyacyl-[acyl-carrier protein] dehydratase/trans-2-decenoyl-[acyl-carrier protein] isomerase